MNKIKKLILSIIIVVISTISLCSCEIERKEEQLPYVLINLPNGEIVEGYAVQCTIISGILKVEFEGDEKTYTTGVSNAIIIEQKE